MDISIKLRGFILDKDSGCPLSGVVVAAVAEPDDTIKLPLGVLVSDTAGYVSFDLKCLSDLHITSIKHLWVYAIGDEDAKIDLAAGYGRPGSSDIGSHKPESQSLIGRLCFPFLLKVDATLACRGNQRINLSSIQNPDLCDCELSPYSFSVKTDVLLGEAGCEVPVPSVEAEREYRFSQVVRTTAFSLTSGTGMGPAIGTAYGPPATGLTQAYGPSINPLDPFTVPYARDNQSITYGEVLEFTQNWIPGGHALGSIVYSLPLAPCESVNIAVIDWSRKDYIVRTDAIVSKESLDHSQRRDRIIDEAVNAAIKESQGGWSLLAGISGAESVGASASVPVGGIPIALNLARSIVGSLGGGISNSWGNRDLTGQSIQQLHDSVIQATNVTRSLNSTVIVQATQEESNYLETRTITNHNHCHALTVQYYEVLRRFKVVTEYIRSRRAVLVPYKILEFTDQIALRFRTILEAVLLDSRLLACFDAIVRLRRCSGLYVTSPATTNGHPSIPTGTAAFYRLFNSTKGDHFYTTDSAERDQAIQVYGYSDEGVTCYIFPSQASGSVPFYRLFNSTNGDHFYTTDSAERDQAIQSYGYGDEGITGYVFKSQAAGTVPFYRLFKKDTGDHFYTTDSTERNQAIEWYGYSDEGIACYVFKAAPPATIQTATPKINRYELRLKTGDNGTWGAIWVDLGLKDGSWKRLFSKDPAKGTITGEVTEGFALPKNDYYTTDITYGETIGLAAQNIERVRVIWWEANDQDWWPFEGIRILYWAQGSSGKLIDQEGIPLKRFDNIRESAGEANAWVTSPTRTGTAPTPQPEATKRSEASWSKEADECCEQQLLTHLKANNGYYNRAIWLLQDPSERVMMLDEALSSYPQILNNIDTTPIAVSGNYVAFPYNSEPTKEEKEREQQRLANITPSKSVVSVPTRGVFAETHLSPLQRMRTSRCHPFLEVGGITVREAAND